MAQSVSFNREIEYNRYTITNILGVGRQYSELRSTIKNATPIVHFIEYSEETNTFQMTDFIKVRGRKVKIMFNLDLNLNIVGFIYNDLDGSYDMIDIMEFYYNDTKTVYEDYINKLTVRLSKFIEKQENKYSEDNRKMLSLQNN